MISRHHASTSVELHTKHKLSLAPNFQEGCQFSCLAVNKRIKRIECIENKNEREHRASDDEKQVNEVVINVKEWTGGHSFTSGVSP